MVNVRGGGNLGKSPAQGSAGAGGPLLPEPDESSPEVADGAPTQAHTAASRPIHPQRIAVMIPPAPEELGRGGTPSMGRTVVKLTGTRRRAFSRLVGRRSDQG